MDAALHSPVARKLLGHFAKATIPSHAASSFSFASLPLPSTLRDDTDNVTRDNVDAQWQMLQAAVAALTAFIQLNWTGPDVSPNVRPVALLRWAEPSAFPPRSATSDGDIDEALEARLNNSATDLLTISGEPAYHLSEHPFLLVFALQVLDALYISASSATQACSQATKLETLPWWRLRAASIHNKVLDNAVPLSDEITVPVDTLANSLGLRSSDFVAAAAADASSNQPWQLLQARLLIERGLALSRTGQDKEANDHFVRAARATGLKYELSGAMGKRTKFQKEEKTILVVLAESSADTLQWDAGSSTIEQPLVSTLSATAEADDAEVVADAFSGLTSSVNAQKSGWQAAPDLGQHNVMPSNYSLNDELLLEQTRFTSNAKLTTSISHRYPDDQPALTSLDQCILLALSLSIRNTSPEHGLTSSQISAFVSRVTLHPRNWSVYTMALLLRSRLEATRTRTAERAVLQLHALLDQMFTADSSSEERLTYFFQLELPARWELQAELAKRYATLGVLRSALEIYERIELWEEAVHCLGALGRQEEGIDIVKDLLAGTKTEANQVLANKKSLSSSVSAQTRQCINAVRQGKLWCLLGDLEPEKSESHYLTGWEMSEHHSARVARSLGRLYFSKQDYVSCIRWLHRALKISSLMPNTWFMLGCAYMREEAFGKAARSFRRATAIDEEDSEAWNNLASCYLQMVADGDRVTVEDLENDDVVGDAGTVEDDTSDARSDTGSRTTAMSTGTERIIKTDPGVQLTDDEAEDADEFAEQIAERRRTHLSPVILKTLAHRCLKHSLRYSPDSWRVWSNFMIVSVDIGELGEACRALGKIVLLKARLSGGRLREEDVDWDVVERLVDAVVRAPGATAEEEGIGQQVPRPPSRLPPAGSSETETVPELSYQDAMVVAACVPVGGGVGSSDDGNGPLSQSQNSSRSRCHQALNPNVGRGLYPSLLDLFSNTLLPMLSTPRLHRAHARLLVWRREYPEAMEAHLAAYRCSVAASRDNATASQQDRVKASGGDHSLLWHEAVSELRETVDSLETLASFVGAGRDAAETGDQGEDDAERKVRFKARSLVRTFLSRNKEMWEDAPEWNGLLELRDSLK